MCRFCFVFVGYFCLWPTLFLGEDIVVAVKPAPPFVMQNAESLELSGFSIDLMNKVGAVLDPPRKVVYKMYPDLASHLKAIQSGEVDLGIAATTITREREHKMDFSYPFYHTGLGIAVEEKRGKSRWSVLFNQEMIFILIFLGIYVLACAHLIWWFERKENNFERRWLPGIIQGVWWAVVTMSTVGYGDFVPKRTTSRVLAIMIIFSGILLFGLVIANFTSSLTLQNIKTDIHKPEDLFDKRVAVLSNTHSEEIMKRMRIKTSSHSSLSEAFAEVKKGKSDAVVHDMPLLQYNIKENLENRLILTGGLFEPADYGICFPLKSPLRKQVNMALLELKEGENSFYDQLISKWFSAERRFFRK